MQTDERVYDHSVMFVEQCALEDGLYLGAPNRPQRFDCIGSYASVGRLELASDDRGVRFQAAEGLYGLRTDTFVGVSGQAAQPGKENMVIAQTSEKSEGTPKRDIILTGIVIGGQAAEVQKEVRVFRSEEL